MNCRQWVVDVILVQTPSRWRRVQTLVVRSRGSGVSKNNPDAIFHLPQNPHLQPNPLTTDS